MCGIVGYLGNASDVDVRDGEFFKGVNGSAVDARDGEFFTSVTSGAVPVLFDLLKKLEYRGYDSAGIAILNDENDEIRTFKTEGSVGDLISITPDLGGRIGIGHTRWATHGKPSTRNAHPHSDGTGRIALVHNGIIENYAEIKDKLIESGHEFRSETDTEVLPHLIEEYYDGDLESAVRNALSMVRGSYALAAISANNPDRIVVARKNSPLVLGLGRGGFFVASDASGILKYTRDVVFMNEGEIGVITDAGIDITTLEGVSVEKKIETIEWDPESAEKSGYEHFMLKEIFEQPDTIRDTFSGRISADGIDLGVALPNVRRIVIIACGTSYHAGLFGRYVIERFARIPVDVEIASEFRYADPIIDCGDLVIAITQSGETADTLAAVREAGSKGSQKLGIVNALGSSITRECQCLFTRAGPEIGVAATKSFTSQLACLLLLSVELGKARKTLSTADVNDFVYELKQTSGNIQRVLNSAPAIRECASMFADADQFLFMGRGANYPVALEGALKLKEISYIPAEGFPAGELKHGPLALIYDGIPVVAIATKDPVYEKTLGNIKEVKARGATVIGIDSEIAGVVEPYATLHGNIRVGKGSIIRNGSYITGPVIIGANCDIGPNCFIRPGTAIGDTVRIGNAVEVKNSIVMDGTNIGHLSYVGDSVIGRGCNLGAGTKIANLRHDGRNIRAVVKGESVDTGRRKLGVVMGDGVHTGINTSINVGVMMAACMSTRPGEVVMR